MLRFFARHKESRMLFCAKRGPRWSTYMLNWGTWTDLSGAYHESKTVPGRRPYTGSREGCCIFRWVSIWPVIPLITIRETSKGDKPVVVKAANNSRIFFRRSAFSSPRNSISGPPYGECITSLLCWFVYLTHRSQSCVSIPYWVSCTFRVFMHRKNNSYQTTMLVSKACRFPESIMPESSCSALL
jgi:hypothetical protein